jgi:hypothetical protein
MFHRALMMCRSRNASGKSALLFNAKYRSGTGMLLTP